jgi:hypothetical protein
VRASLRHSMTDSPAGADESFRYPAGSIVICNACAVPVAILERGIAIGDKAGRMAGALKPLRTGDVDALAAREDIDAGVRAWARGLTPAARVAYLERLHGFSTGDPMICPTCHHCFVQVIACERDAVLDKAYVIELVTLPPQGQRVLAVRGTRIGVRDAWLHPLAKGVQ